MSSETAAPSRGLVLKSAAWVAPLCWIAVLLDGFDAVVLGAVMPALLADQAWGMTTGEATAVATAGLFGMMVGALGMGYLTDRWGRRKMLIGAVIVFSVLTFAAAFAPTVLWFGILRFLAGLGLGGCLPTGISMVTEFSRPGRGSHATTVMMTGYHVGAVLTAALAIWVLSHFTWHTMFIAGALPALILVPLMLVFLPESPSYLASKGRLEDARRVATHYNVPLEIGDAAPAASGARGAAAPSAQVVAEKKGAALLLSGTYARNSVVIWIASFMGLLLVYGLNTWLPQIMRAADYDLGNALGFLLILNVGAVVGLWIGGRVADRITPPHREHYVVRGLGRAARGPRDPAARGRDLRHGVPDRVLRVLFPGARVRVHRDQPPAARARDRPGHVRRGGASRRDQRSYRGRHAAGCRARVPVGLLRVRRGRCPGQPGHGRLQDRGCPGPPHGGRRERRRPGGSLTPRPVRRRTVR